LQGVLGRLNDLHVTKIALKQFRKHQQRERLRQRAEAEDVNATSSGTPVTPSATPIVRGELEVNY
jgi:hypothetical protein